MAAVEPCVSKTVSRCREAYCLATDFPNAGGVFYAAAEIWQ
jgi:hypothetical protein